jgi:hypothetical protein
MSPTNWLGSSVGKGGGTGGIADVGGGTLRVWHVWVCALDLWRAPVQGHGGCRQALEV